MKKLLALLMLLCLLPLCAAAEAEDNGVTVALDGAEVYFVPFEGYCLTRETSASVFNRLGMSQREVVPWMEANGVYALMFDTAGEMEVQIVVSPTTELDFDEMNQYGLESMCEVNASYYTSSGADVMSSELYHTFDGHTYVKTVCSYTYEDGSVEHMVEYLTSQSGYAVSVFVFPYEGVTTEAQMLQAEGVVESLWLSKNPVEEGAEAGYAELTQGKVSVRFQMPEGMRLLTKDSGEEEWAGLPKGYVRGWKKALAWGEMQGMIPASDGTWEIRWILIDEGSLGDLDEVSDAEADELCQEIVQFYIEDGYNVSNGTCVWRGAYRYICTNYNYADVGSLVHVEEYYTTQQGRGIFVSLTSYGQPVPDAASALLEEIMESQIVIVDR